MVESLPKRSAQLAAIWDTVHFHAPWASQSGRDKWLCEPLLTLHLVMLSTYLPHTLDYNLGIHWHTTKFTFVAWMLQGDLLREAGTFQSLQERKMPQGVSL